MKDYLNINEAAKETGLSIPTIRLKLSRGMLPNAHQVQEGKRQLWRIPFNDLIAAGLVDKVGQKAITDNYAEGLRRDLESLAKELEATRELLNLTTQTLDEYRERERRIFHTLETRETQEKRRSLWGRLRG